ncbi:hypothetical protein roselon_02209 [Roseibacterium elongatum DSM 19469]|uniref:Uncharacterized protein n=1 Tax=Roseicyclus elongatus DSM 19469 TaxID=1294273 RepID=W8RTK5_9RHOB|nr:hypothetical protein roselon_02209 [Roseibacterium elongatum DSM 19469]
MGPRWHGGGAGHVCHPFGVSRPWFDGGLHRQSGKNAPASARGGTGAPAPTVGSTAELDSVLDPSWPLLRGPLRRAKQRQTWQNRPFAGVAPCARSRHRKTRCRHLALRWDLRVAVASPCNPATTDHSSLHVFGRTLHENLDQHVGGPGLGNDRHGDGRHPGLGQ